MFIRRSHERGNVDHGWLKSAHSFSFANYYDPRFMGFKSLRVINEDHISPESGFGTHPHNNMEIITYVVQGELTHEDSLGHKEKLVPGEIQVMSAGNGIRHSEYNKASAQSIHLFQIWILPESLGGEPRYQQVSYLDHLRTNKWLSLVSPEGGGGLTHIKQHASLKLFKSEQGRVELPVQTGFSYWLQVVHGPLKSTSGETLESGDALAFEAGGSAELVWKSESNIELLLFELAS